MHHHRRSSGIPDFCKVKAQKGAFNGDNDNVLLNVMQKEITEKEGK